MTDSPTLPVNQTKQERKKASAQRRWARLMALRAPYKKLVAAAQKLRDCVRAGQP